MNEPGGPKRAVKTTETSIGILEELEADAALSLEELSGRFEHSRSTVHRHLATLEKHGLVVREEGAYRLGLRLLGFGKRAQERSELYEVSNEFVERLARETGDHVWLSALERHHSVVVCSIIEDRPFEGDFLTGVRRPLHASADGLAVLATFPDEAVRELVATYAAVGETPAVDEDALRSDLEEIRERGYALRTTPESGQVSAIAKAIQTQAGECVGAISIADTKGRTAGELVDEGYDETVTQAANEIEILLRLPE